MIKKKVILLVIISILMIIIFFFFNLNKKNLNIKEVEKMDVELKVKINDTTYEVTLLENETTKELLKRLPLTISMNELNNNERYYYFKDKFPSNPLKVKEIKKGDIMLYGDTCLVIFYEDFETNYTYTRIGKINNPISLKENLDMAEGMVSFVK